MAMNRPALWVVTYDIREPRRLVRLHRFLRRCALPVQYSVFVLRESPARVGQLAREIEERIDPKVDDVRIYRVTEPVDAVVLGRSMLPPDILLVNGHSDLLMGSPTGTVKRETRGVRRRR